MFNITELTCRICLEEKDVIINIYDDLEDLNTNLSNLLETCANLEIKENDIFPKYLCDECTRELLVTSHFREKCNKSTKILCEILENTKALYNDELSNSNDIIEYCNEYAEDIDLDDLIIEDFVVGHEEQSEQLIDDVEHVKPDVDMSSFNVNEDNILSNPNLQERVIEETTLSEDHFNQSHIKIEKTLETADMISLNEYEITEPSILLYESINKNVRKPPNEKCKIIHIFKCDVCGALFKQAINLQKHLQKAHDLAHSFACNKCDHSFSLETEFCKHVEKCNCIIEVTAGNTKPKSENIFSATEKTDGSRKCIYCERCFSTPFALRMHLRTHTGERPFLCKYCTKTFKTQSQLNVHHKRHTGQADFICEFCNKSFYEQSNLTAHVRSHTGERPHVCTVCNKTFARVFLLQFHMRIHTGEKPFKCNYCYKSFRQHTDLRSHVTIHTGQKQHTCILCGKSYIKRSHLVQHMRKHQVCSNIAEIEITESEIEHSQEELDSAGYTNRNHVPNSETIHNLNQNIEEDIIANQEFDQ